MNIVEATESDLDLLATMNRDLIQDEGHRNKMGLSQLKKRMQEWLRGEYRAVLFKADEKVVGYALWMQGDEHIYLRQFFI